MCCWTSSLGTHLSVREPVEGERLRCTTIYVGAPSDSVEVDWRFAHVVKIEKSIARMKRIDALFESAAKQAGPNAVDVILSSMLSDGVEGMKAIEQAGGKCIIQKPGDAQYPDMPLHALDAVTADFLGTPEEIAAKLTELAAGRTCK